MSDTEIVLLPVKGFEVNKNEVELNNLSFCKLQNIGNLNGQLQCVSKPKPFARSDSGSIVDGYFVILDTIAKRFFFAVQIGKDCYELNFSNSNNVALNKFCTIYQDSTSDVLEVYKDYVNDSIMQSATWYYQDNYTCYFTKPGLPLSKFEFTDEGYKAVTVPATYENEQSNLCYLSARYIIATNNRLFLGNCYENSDHWSTRIHWSNLNNPDDWKVSTTSEADYFDLGANSSEITGLGYANDILFVFSKNSIWRSDYESFETKFKTTKLSSIGCPHHYSVITVDDKIYFIGHNNIYMLDNLTLSPIGTEIWDWFYNHHSHNKDSTIIAQYDQIKNCIIWSFEEVVNGESLGTINLVYSINTQTWFTTK